MPGFERKKAGDHGSLGRFGMLKHANRDLWFRKGEVSDFWWRIEPAKSVFHTWLYLMATIDDSDS